MPLRRVVDKSRTDLSQAIGVVRSIVLAVMVAPIRHRNCHDAWEVEGPLWISKFRLTVRQYYLKSVLRHRSFLRPSE